MKTVASAIAIIAGLGLGGGMANAACNPAPTTSGGDTLTITATDCHLVITDPAVLPIVPGMGIVVHDPITGEVGSDGGALIADVNAALAAKADTTYVDSQNAAQDIVTGGNSASIVALQSGHAAQQVQIDTATSVNNVQQTTINTHTTQIATHTSQITAIQGVNTVQNGRLDSLETLTADHSAAINAHSALLSEHTARLDEQEKGLAIAMALPDAWLSDKKSFGIFGSVGGYNGETAVGFAAIGRLDETWSLNAKFGSDTEGKQFGWQAGFGAQW